ncbi:mCG1041184, partial [Mus musculus]
THRDQHTASWMREFKACTLKPANSLHLKGGIVGWLVGFPRQARAIQRNPVWKNKNKTKQKKNNYVNKSDNKVDQLPHRNTDNRTYRTQTLSRPTGK